jgi:hypothetical protein
MVDQVGVDGGGISGVSGISSSSATFTVNEAWPLVWRQVLSGHLKELLGSCVTLLQAATATLAETAAKAAKAGKAGKAGSNGSINEGGDASSSVASVAAALEGCVPFQLMSLLGPCLARVPPGGSTVRFLNAALSLRNTTSRLMRSTTGTRGASGASGANGANGANGGNRSDGAGRALSLALSHFSFVWKVENDTARLTACAIRTHLASMPITSIKSSRSGGGGVGGNSGRYTSCDKYVESNEVGSGAKAEPETAAGMAPHGRDNVAAMRAVRTALQSGLLRNGLFMRPKDAPGTHAHTPTSSPETANDNSHNNSSSKNDPSPSSSFHSRQADPSFLNPGSLVHSLVERRGAGLLIWEWARTESTVLKKWTLRSLPDRRNGRGEAYDRIKAATMGAVVWHTSYGSLLARLARRLRLVNRFNAGMLLHISVYIQSMFSVKVSLN